MDVSPAHQAVEMGLSKELYELLKAGADVHEEHDGLTLLHHALDVEIDAVRQTGAEFHADMTTLLLLMGADPTRRSHGGRGVSSEHVAFVEGHWLALLHFEEWKRAHPTSTLVS
ncbi:ankyrin repeat domain-containing protein [Hamadaea sp. NPDC050747]|uniref:ankyrin repeat domain-containing protein n=1 Tax=Hamadaea sp. NPDC050747 TaxID=3155789 RepID=UPI00341192A1